MQRQFLHTMKNRFFIALLLLSAMLCSARESTLDSLISVLDKEIAHADVYTARKKQFIESLCAMRPMTPDLQLRIAREYQHFQCDSSRAWFLKLQHAEDPIRREAFFSFVKLLASSGYHADAVTMLEGDASPAPESVEEFKMAWLKEYLSDPARMDDFMAELLKKQLADSVKNNGKKGTPPPPPIK